ncbi:MAG: CDP-alcohol phosphatidyltransferase family protein [Phycisphaerae bacterium]
MAANLLTAVRMLLAAGFVITVAIAGTDPIGLVPYIFLWVFGLPEELTDLFDGYVARKTGTVSRFGGIFDPMSDSLSRLAIYFAMALAGWVHIALPLFMAGRDIVVAYTRIVNALTGGKTNARISGKIKGLSQSLGIPAIGTLALLSADDFGGSVAIARHITAGLIAAVTFWSLTDYLRQTWPNIRKLASEKPTS